MALFTFLQTFDDWLSREFLNSVTALTFHLLHYVVFFEIHEENLTLHLLGIEKGRKAF